MKILIYGAGVQGSYLAHILSDGGNDVTVLARGTRAEEIKEGGIVLYHYLQRKNTVNKVQVISELLETDYYDIIFVTMKYSDFPSVLPILVKNSSKNIVMIGNNATAKDMQSFFDENSDSKKNIAFGFQLNGGKREPERVVCLRFDNGKMEIGSLEGEIPFKKELGTAFRNTKYTLNYRTNIDDWLKSHMISVLAMNMVAYLHDNNFKVISKDKQMLKQLVNAMDEGFMVLQDFGYEITPQLAASFYHKRKTIAYYFYKFYHKLPMAKLVDGSFLEIIALLDAFDLLKKESKVSTPAHDDLRRRALKKYQDDNK